MLDNQSSSRKKAKRNGTVEIGNTRANQYALFIGIEIANINASNQSENFFAS